MIKKNLTDLQELYWQKTTHLENVLEEVRAEDFYRDLFPEGSFETRGDYDAQLPNGIVMQVVQKDDGKTYALNHLVFDDLDVFADMEGVAFAITSPVSYFGKRRVAENSRYLYAFTFDLDGVGMPQLRDTLHQMNTGWIPMANFVVNSGTGLHLYYLLDSPIPMYPKNRKMLKALKYALIERIWNGYTSTLEKRQMQGIVQGYRVVGSQTKLGEDYLVRAYRHREERWTIEALLEFVFTDKQRDEIRDTLKPSKLSLEQAKKKYPEWYDKRVVNNEPRGRWYVKRDLYDWWFRRIQMEATVHHRYWCIACLAIFARKCEGSVTEDELRTDAFSLLDRYEMLTVEDTNHFTEQDIIDALEIYNEAKDEHNTRVKRDTIAEWSGLDMPVNRRNYRKQGAHLKRARIVQELDYPDGEWRNKDGASTKEQMIRAYAAEHPEARHGEIAKTLGVSRPTVVKYLGSSQPKVSNGAKGKPSKQQLVLDYLETHPTATAKEIAEALGISVQTAKKWLKGGRDT